MFFDRIHFFGLLVLLTLAPMRVALCAGPPNIVYIMSDELAYYEVSHMGSKMRTPRIDAMAKEGVRFTNALAGSPVCGPLRCNLMTGKHAGHASVRVNDGGTPLRAGEATIASLLKAKGYATGGFGKWGCGGRDSTGVPEKHGFDVFFGYYDQVHAHSFYPPYLVRNSEEVQLPGNIGGRSGKTYSHYEIMRDGLQWIRDNKDRPFFCYFPITPPHGMYDIPATDPAWKAYENDAWMQDPELPQDVKSYAAMVTMVDNNVGQVLDLLRELKLEDNTLVIFSGDNGGQDRFRSQEHPRGYYGPNVNPKSGVEFRGGKGNLYDGGLKIPFIVRWPGKVPAGRVSDLVFYQPDMLPTLTELAGAETPDDADGLSILPEIMGRSEQQKKHDWLYWEYGSQVAVREGDWKAIRPRKDSAWELYNLKVDVSEANDVAADHADQLAQLKAIAAREHEPVEPGTFLDAKRVRHNRDRAAKWGTARLPQRQPRTRTKTLTGKNMIQGAKLKVVRASSENAGNDKLAAHAVDGDPRTVWHSQFSPKLEKHPHEIVLDLGVMMNVSGIRYLSRQDNGWNGAFGETEVYVSPTADEFSDKPAVTVTFGKLRTTQAADMAAPVRGRYVKIRILSEVNRMPWASAAEIGVIAKP